MATCTSPSARGPTSRSSAGWSITSSANERWFKEYVLHYTNAATIVSDSFRDTEDLDGLFSGYDPEQRSYDTKTWAYEGTEAGQPRMVKGVDQPHTRKASRDVDYRRYPPRTDPTLQHPRCVFQILKRHYARYTPEMVARICGCTEAQFLEVAETLCDNSGRERTSAFAYAVGWTQHTVGVQIHPHRGAGAVAARQHRAPGGGILALRGHATIQGSTDIATLYNLLPGYLTAPQRAGGRARHARWLAGARDADDRLVGQRAEVHGLPAQGLVRRRGHRRQRVGLPVPAQERRATIRTCRCSWPCTTAR